MIKILCLMMVTTFIVSFSYPQENDQLIQLSYGMGDTLDLIDREILELYPDIEGFKHAQLFNRDNKFLISRITFLNNSILRDTLLVEDYHQLYFLRQHLTKFKLENDKKSEFPLTVSLFTKSGKDYNGRLQCFSKKYLYLNSDVNYLTDSPSTFNFQTPISKIDSMQISVNRGIGPYLGYGALGGAALGAAVGIYWINNVNFWKGYGKYIVGITTLTGAGIGLLLGWLVESTLSPDILIVRFNSPYDIVKLKEYSTYYFQYDKSLVGKYLEIE